MSRPHLRLLLAGSTLLLAACQNKGSKWNNPRDEAAFHPANLTAGGTRPAPTGAPEGVDAEKTGAPLDAMIGQVNGKPLYADPILKPMEPELTRLGKTLPLRPFAEEAKKLLVGALLEAVQGAQLLGKAEASLKEGQRAGLDGIVERQREELLRQYGQGSQALAEANIFKEKGVTLKEELRAYREKQLIGYYMYQKITPLINVTRRDIERYYADHQGDFNKPEARAIALIHAKSPLDAVTISAALNAGKSFADVASDPALNSYNPAKGGDWGEPIVGNPQLRWPELNAAILSLKTKGAWSGPVLTKTSTPRGEQTDTWFVGLAAFQPGVSRSLDDAQLEIRGILSNIQNKKFSEQINAKAAQEGSCSDMTQMADTLLRVAIARYAAKAGQAQAQAQAQNPAPSPAPAQTPTAP